MYRVRPATGDDEAFLLAVYVSTRETEFHELPWTPEQLAAFLATQWEWKRAALRSTYPDDGFQVIETDAEGEPLPVGYLFLAAPADVDRRVVEVALLTPWRNRGLGTAILTDVVAGADLAGAAVTLQVERANPARRLYERFGFTEVSRDDVYVAMRRAPTPPRA